VNSSSGLFVNRDSIFGQEAAYNIVRRQYTMSDIQHPTVSIEFAGKWVAWNHAVTKIIASGSSPGEVIAAAKSTGEPNPILDKVPAANVRLIGAGIR
jgi:hypothetical protein